MSAEIARSGGGCVVHVILSCSDRTGVHDPAMMSEMPTHS